MPYHPNLLLSILNYVSIVIFFVETPLQQSFYSQPNMDGNDEYDYIIVGAGSAGCVLANRLSADLKTRVLLLEAGGPEEAAARVPYFTTLLQFTRMDWGYHSAPQKNASYGLHNRINTLPRGKTLGGTSSMNFMVYSRGNHRDYDSWQNDYGAENWSYAHVQKDFLDIETSYLETEPAYHGKTGEVPVSFPSDTTQASKVFLEAGKELGYNECDYNGANQTCFSRVQRNAKDGERWSSSRSFITNEVRCRPNLHISLYSHVTEIIIKNKVAVGVNYTRQLKNYSAMATREVILSAGAIGSAQLLMLSGIGPEDHLRSLKIEVKANLPVGQKMYDHVLVYGLLAVENKTNIDNEPSLLQALSDYALFRKGPLIYPSGVDSVAFLNTRGSDPKYPDIQFFMVTPYPKPIELPKIPKYCPAELYPERCPTIYHILLRNYFFSVAPILLRPKSSGFIRLTSTNPYDHPLIDPQLLSNTSDLETMIKGVHTAVCLMKTDAMVKANVTLLDIPIESCKNHTIWSYQYIRCLVQHNSHSGWHPCCTAPMGNHSDAVLDSRLRVKNISRLRVVDASSMPYLASGNIHVPIMMMAHRAARMIKEDHTERKDTGEQPASLPLEGRAHPYEGNSLFSGRAVEMRLADPLKSRWF